MKLEKLINNCGKNYCPLYSNNAQSNFRIKQYNLANPYFSNKVFHNSIGNFGAKLLLIMESPPPKFEEYFYGSSGGFEKEKSLFSSVLQAIINVEGNSKYTDPDKNYWLSWISELGIFITDSSKCRVKFDNSKISNNAKVGSYCHCSDILRHQIININPFRLVIGIKRVFDSRIVHTICDELSLSDRLINKEIKYPTSKYKADFISKIENIWKVVKDDFSKM